MLYKVIEISGNIKKIWMIDRLSKCNDRVKQLRSSKRSNFVIEKCDGTATQKYKVYTHSLSWKSGDYPIIPKRTR